MVLEPITASFAAEIADLDLAALTDAQFRSVREALDHYGVLVLPGQGLSESALLAFAGRFGPLEISVGAAIYDNKDNTGRKRRLAHRELSDISNLDEQGGVLGTDDVRRLINISNQLWHTDSSFKQTPASVSLLSAQEIPPAGGFTEFADMRAAWDALPPAQQAALEARVAIHDYFHSRGLTGFDVGSVPAEWRARQPPVRQRLVRTHPANGRRSLYLASHIREIEGMPEAEGRALVDSLMAFATEPRFVYRHRWRADDLVLWDNRCTMHRGRPFKDQYRRSMRRATVQDSGPTIASAES